MALLSPTPAARVKPPVMLPSSVLKTTSEVRVGDAVAAVKSLTSTAPAGSSDKQRGEPLAAAQPKGQSVVEKLVPLETQVSSDPPSAEQWSSLPRGSQAVAPSAPSPDSCASTA